MKKNKKGFTLIELLAVLVLLGILSVLSLPVLSRAIRNSRNRMFITDAKKLVSLAESKMRAESSDIILPDPGECIVISLSYLNTSSISTGPNGGVYDLDSSFVVVVNVNGTLDYSVSLVERSKKGTYAGLPLLRNDTLYSPNGRKVLSEIIGFTSETLVDVDSIDAAYIENKINEDITKQNRLRPANNKIPSINVTKITQVYHYQDAGDIVTDSGKHTPVIRSIELRPKGNGNFGSLKAVLSIKASDMDTPKKDLKVYVSTTGFDAPNSVSYNYGEYVFCSIEIDFGQFGYSQQENRSVSLYVTVKDKDDNADRQILDYKIHSNNSPTIMRSSFLPLNTEDSDFTGVLTLSVYDDLDDLASLQVCLTESKDATTCNRYQNYLSLFVADNQTNYTFSCGSGCQRDGKIHYLKAFIKDSSNAVTVSDAFPFAFPADGRLEFDGDVTVTSKSESFTTQGSKNVIVSAKVKNAPTGAKVCIGATNTTDVCYDYQESGKYSFSINSPYDGLTKNIYVYALDANEVSSVVKDLSYTMYKDLSPNITRFQLSSDGNPCLHEELCEGATGSIHTILNVAATDDIDAASDLKLCVSTKKSYCDNLSNYKSYNSYRNGSFTMDEVYDGKLKTVYAFVRDSKGNVGESSTRYQLYSDQQPIIASNPTVEAADNDYDISLLDLYYTPNVIDDVDSRLMYQICYKIDSSAFYCEDSIYSSNGVFHLDESFFSHKPTDYLGQTITIYANVKDSYHSDSIQTSDVTYTLYNDAIPEISKYSVVYQGTTATLSFVVKDYMDEYQVGASSNGNCGNVTYSTTKYGGNDLYTHTLSYIYPGSVTSTTLCVKDGHDHVVSKTATPVESGSYTLCSSLDTSHASYQYSATSTNQKITRTRCDSKCYAYNPLTKQNNSVRGQYNRTITYLDAFHSNSSCPVTDVYTADCSFKDCFLDSNNGYYQAIGLMPYEDVVPWTYQLNGVTYINYYHYKLYQSSYNAGDKNITLTEIQDRKISPALLTDTESMKNYVRIAD